MAMSPDDKYRWDRMKNGHFQSLYVIVRLGDKEWAIGAAQRDQLAAQADAIEPNGLASVEEEESKMPSVWECRCHCCGNMFDAKRYGSKWCGATCRKRAERREARARSDPLRDFFKPEYRLHRPTRVRRSAGDS